MESAPESKSHIAAKMVQAMSVIEAIEKRGENTAQHYKFVRSADVANEVRKQLVKLGIAFTYDVLEQEHWESLTKSGGINHFCSIRVRCTFTDSDTGETMSGCVVGWGTDSQDKAPYKAMTGAVKYALRMNFLIPDEAADPEVQEEKNSDDSLIDEEDIQTIARGCKFHQIPKEDFRDWVEKTFKVTTTRDLKRSQMALVTKWLAAAPIRRNEENIARQSMSALGLSLPEQSALITKHNAVWSAISAELDTRSKSDAAIGEFFHDGAEVQCVVIDAVKRELAGGREYVEITMNGRIEGKNKAACWHKSLFDALISSPGKVTFLTVKMMKDFITVENVSRIGSDEYMKGLKIMSAAYGENQDAEPVE
jgi:hypothetical protein